MIFRLSIVTTLMATFALGFSALVHSETRAQGPMIASHGCFDQGAVCAKSSLMD